MLSEADLTDALDLAQAAIAHAVDYARHHTPRAVRYKGDRDPVSEVDEGIEQLVRQHLGVDENSAIGFVGEETGSVGNPDTCWVLDPIDGTINHQHGSPLCAIALGLVHDDVPVLGVTALPFLGQCYWAVQGRGAYRDEVPISAASTEHLDQALIGMSDYGSGPGAALRDLLSASIDRTLTGRAQGVRRLGSSSLDLVWVADGTLDACILLGNRPWDTAAGSIIAREAGAVVLDADASPHTVRSRCAIAAAAGLRDELLTFLAPLRGTHFWPDKPSDQEGVGP